MTITFFYRKYEICKENTKTRELNWIILYVDIVYAYRLTRQQKLYITTAKNTYTPSSRIWLKSAKLNLCENLYFTTFSKNIYSVKVAAFVY